MHFCQKLLTKIDPDIRINVMVRLWYEVLLFHVQFYIRQ